MPKRFSVLLFLATIIASAQIQSQAPIDDMKLLIGRKAIAQRMPFYVPGTYQAIPNSYAGQTAMIVEVKPSAVFAMMPKLTARQMASLPPQSRQLIENTKTASTIVIQFEDGTKADTGATPVMASTLPTYLELLPDSLAPKAGNETVVQTTAAPTQAPPTATIPKLSPSAVQAAIQGNGKDHWVTLMDGGAGNPQLTPKIGYAELLMPEAIIAQKSATAKSQYLAYTPEGDDDLRALTIVAHGSVGETVQDGCSSITRIVLISAEGGGVIKEAFVSDPIAQTWRNAFGAANQCDDLRAKFSLDDVNAVKVAAKDGEFYVALFSGTYRIKIYKVKKKHQAKLNLQSEQEVSK